MVFKTEMQKGGPQTHLTGTALNEGAFDAGASCRRGLGRVPHGGVRRLSKICYLGTLRLRLFPHSMRSVHPRPQVFVETRGTALCEDQTRPQANVKPQAEGRGILGWNQVVTNDLTPSQICSMTTNVVGAQGAGLSNLENRALAG